MAREKDGREDCMALFTVLRVKEDILLSLPGDLRTTKNVLLKILGYIVTKEIIFFTHLA